MTTRLFPVPPTTDGPRCSTGLVLRIVNEITAPESGSIDPVTGEEC
jgi:hypothetical protein